MNTTIEELAAPARVDLAWKRSGSELLESNETESVTCDQRRDDRVRNACSLLTSIENHKSSRSKPICSEEHVASEDTLEGIIGRSTAMRALCKQVQVVAPTGSTVLILGETGTGKELIARATHNLSPRRDRPFIRVNCAAIPAGLIESELFGHERGAFTGALARKIGRFELADRGTIFLDEIGELPL